MRNELTEKFEQLGSRIAIVHNEVTHTYSDLARETRNARRWLTDHDVAAHDVVVLTGDFSFLSIATLLALHANRNIVIPMVHLAENSLTTITESCHPRHLVRVGKELSIEPMRGVPEDSSNPYDRLIEADAAGLVLLSSGSTGAPKAILHNLDALVEEKVGTSVRVGRSTPHILLFLLFDHIGGINSLLGVLGAGSTAVIPGRRTPEEICMLIEKYRIRLLPTSPTFLNLILVGNFHEKFDLTSLRLISYGTEPMPEELLKRLNAVFPRTRLLQTFGTSETGVSTTTSESSSSTYFKISDDNVQYRIVDGELQLKSRTQYMGYLNYPDDALTADGWFRTGDLVEENADGFLKVKGRAKEIINVGGEKVLPMELESILIGSPLIEDCVVYGMANSITGQAVHVDVKPATGMTRPEVRKHVRDFLDGKVEQFKMPAKVNIVDEIEVSERFKKRRVRA